MIKDFMWDHFERTGDINAYLCFRECGFTRECHQEEDADN